MLKRLMIALSALLIATATAFTAEVKVLDGKTFTFLDPARPDNATLLSVFPGYFIMNRGSDDEMIGDLEGGDIWARGPDGQPMSMRQMVGRFGGTAGGASASTNAAPIDDPDAEFNALIEGLPPTLKNQLKAQFSLMPRADAIKALRVLRGQMGLPTVTPGDLPAAAPASGVQATGATQNHNGVTLHEYLVAGDRIFAANVSDMPHGAVLLDALVEFGALYKDVSQGFPVADASIFRVHELDGRVPYIVMTGDGETYIFDSVKDDQIGIQTN